MTVQFIESSTQSPFTWLLKLQQALASNKVVSVVKNGEEITLIQPTKPVLQVTILVDGKKAKDLEEVAEAIETGAAPVHWVDGTTRHQVM